MAVNPTVVQGADPVQAFLAIQKQNQDLIKSALDTMRLQQEVDDRKRQNQWDNTWNVLQEASKNYAGGMAGLIGQNQDLVKQLFKSNGMTTTQANLAVGNLSKTLLTADAQAEVRLAKYTMDPYAMVNEVVETQPAPEQPPQATPVVEKTTPKEEPSLTPVAPKEAPPEEGAKGDPYTGFRYAFQSYLQSGVPTTAAGDWMNTGKAAGTYRGSVDNYNTGVTSKANVDIYGLVPFDKSILLGAVTESGLYDASNPDLAENMFLEDLRLVYLKDKGDPAATKKYNRLMSGAGSGVVDNKIVQRLTFAKSFLDRSGMSQVVPQDTPIQAARQWSLDDTSKSRQNVATNKNVGSGVAGQGAARIIQGNAEAADKNYLPNPGESLESFIMRRSPGATDPRTVWKQGKDESEADYVKRIEKELRVKGRNDNLVALYDRVMAASVSAKTLPATTPVEAAANATVAVDGVTMVNDQVAKTAALYPDSAQGQRAAQLIVTEGTKVRMTFDELLAAQANNRPIDGKTKEAYINYLDKVSESAGDWLSGFAPITDDYLKKITGKTDVAEAYQDFLAWGAGGAQALMDKKQMELQAKSLENTMAQFAATLGFDKEKFDWQKSVDTATLALQAQELQLRSSASGVDPKSDFYKRQLDVIDKYDKLNTGKTPEERMNWMIKTYNEGGEFKNAWDAYVMYNATMLGIPISQLTEATFSRGGIGKLIYSVLGKKELTMPTVPGVLGDTNTGTGTEGAADPKAVDSFNKKIGN